MNDNKRPWQEGTECSDNERPCWNCNGRGTYIWFVTRTSEHIERNCPYCNGDGAVAKEEVSG